MSKSLGNVVAPQEVIKANGAEILRLWVSAEDYREDIRISKEILDRLTEAYRKIRNTCRFILGNLYDFDPEPSSEVDYTQALLEIDRWAMSRLQTLIEAVTTAYENFTFHEVFHALYNFCVVDMSSFYLDVLKDRLYTFKSDSSERRAAQWVLSQILSVMTRLMAPILSFTAEEVLQSMKQRAENKVQSAKSIEESVFLSSFPEVDEKFHDKELEKKWGELFLLRGEVNKALEMKRAERFIGNSLEAKVVLYLAESKEQSAQDKEQRYKTLIDQYKDFLTTFFIVSSAEIADKSLDGSYKSAEIEGLEIKIEKAPGEKCQRCWNWSKAVGSFEEAPEICERCHKVIFG
jgi:isoleucyl-tRNA synthetase